MTWQGVDPSFVTAIESRYLKLCERASTQPETRAESHLSLLASAIFEADPTHGGLRYRALAPEIREELEARLRRYQPRV